MSRKILLPTALALLSATACDRGATTPAAPEATPARTAPAKALTPQQEFLQLVRSTTLGATSGSTEVPVEARFDLREVPVDGRPFALSVIVLPSDAVPILRVEASGNEGISVLEPASPIALNELGAGTLHRVELKAQAQGTGLRILSVTLTAEIPGGAQSRTFSYPLLVKAAAAPGG